MNSTPPPDGSVSVDPDDVERVVADHPVRLAVLFGSHARGTETADSDVDVAVAFDEGLSAKARLEARIDLVVDLGIALGTDAVDVADLDSIRPEIGASALETGIVVVGDRSEIERYRNRFDRETAEADETHAERMRRFDSILDRLEGEM